MAALAVFGFTTANAQGISFGAKAGVNFASLTGDDADGLDGRTSFHVGGVVYIGLSEMFGLQPELVYSSQGFTASVLGVDATGHLDYINIPVLVDVLVAEGFSLQAGPQVGILINDDLDVDGVGSASMEAESVDVSIAAGAQYKMPMGLFFQARYAIGMTDVNMGSIKNSVASLSVGWFFN